MIAFAGLGDRSFTERPFGIIPDWVFEFSGIRKFLCHAARSHAGQPSAGNRGHRASKNDARFRIMEHVDPVFYRDPATAAQKALGL